MDNLEDFDEDVEEHLESIEWLLNTVDTIIDIIFYAGAAFSLLLTICLIYNFLKIKNPLISTAYFKILVIGYVIDLISALTYILSSLLFPNVTAIIHINNAVQWYAKLFVGFWNTVLVLNRLTALLWWNKHERIWSGAPLAGIICILMAYPFAVNGYQLFGDLQCAFKGCTNFVIASRNFAAIANGTNALIALILGVFTACSGRLQLSHGKTAGKLEKRLLIQSIISTILFGSSCILTATYSILYPLRNNLQYSIAFDFTRDFSNLFYMIFHYSSAILLIIVS